MWGQQKQSNDPRNNQHNPQYANYWAPLTRKRHIPPHPAEPRHTDHWAPRTRTRHRQEHRLQRPTERSDPTQHAKGRTDDCPGPRKGTATGRTGTQGGWGGSRGQAGPSCCPRCGGRRFASVGRLPTGISVPHLPCPIRYRWSCGPLTSPTFFVRFRADRRLCTRAIAQNSYAADTLRMG